MQTPQAVPPACVQVDAMTLPNQIRVRITAEGIPVEGMFINVRVKMNRKNDYDLAFGPSDEKGEIVVSKSDLLREAQQLAHFFSMDYVDVESANAGDVLVTTFDANDIERAIAAYEMFAAAGVRYPPNWKMHLLKACEVLKAGISSLLVDVRGE